MLKVFSDILYCNSIILLLATLRWYLLTPKEGTEVITARHSHSAVVHNNAIWIFGGFENRGRKNDLWKWDFGIYNFNLFDFMLSYSVDPRVVDL